MELTMMLHKEITEAILRAFYKVYNTLGYGFLEKVFERALAHELAKQGHTVRNQSPIRVWYDEIPVGDYYADLVVDNRVIVEIKAGESLAPEHSAQLLNYLKATDIEVGLLLNFGPKPTFERKVFANEHKRSLSSDPR
jgi:GxxExxY protein